MDDSVPPPDNSIGLGFPSSPSEFNEDPRISFSKLDDKYILETQNGEEYTFEPVLKRWIPSLDDALVEKQREAYKVQGVDEEEPAHLKAQERKKKRKQTANGDQDGTHKPKKPRVNSAIYVTSIPLDASTDELRDAFCKCGVIAEEIDSGRPRIKMYMDENGNFKGDALIVYFRPESVKLAVQMLDDTDFRLGETGPQGKMRVQLADFSFKAQQDAPAKPNNRDKMKIMRKTQKLNNKLTDWDDDDPSAALEVQSRREKVMVLRRMFTLQELEDDPAAILDIKEDIREDCSKYGEVTNVVLYDKEEAGIVTVRFSDPNSTRACVERLNGRFFAGTQIEAYVATGQEKFKKTSKNKLAALEDDQSDEEDGQEKDEEAERLEKFSTWLEGDGAQKTE